jgi:hypothetical protein
MRPDIEPDNTLSYPLENLGQVKNNDYLDQSQLPAICNSQMLIRQ